jgi:hypothetical protein
MVECWPRHMQQQSVGQLVRDIADAAAGSMGVVVDDETPVSVA